MAKQATKFKRYTNSAINHPGTCYRFKKVLRDPPGMAQESLRYWTHVCCEEGVVTVEVCLRNVPLFTHIRNVVELRAGSKKSQALALDEWWTEILVELRDTLSMQAVKHLIA